MEALLFCSCHPVQVSGSCLHLQPPPPPPTSTSSTTSSSSSLHLLRHHLLMYIPYLRSLIRATSWSGAGPDLICCQREACLWADGPLWSRSSSSSSYKLALFTCCLYVGPAASRSPLTLPLSSFNCCFFNPRRRHLSHPPELILNQRSSPRWALLVLAWR